ncbi:MAG: hypothetical protein K2J82_09230 [Muribaculaceae bacterium]|nr:hypothetical protein [Muribaculaceae bacterium]
MIGITFFIAYSLAYVSATFAPQLTIVSETKGSDYIGYLTTMKKGLFGGVSTYLRHGLEIDFEAQHNDIPEWLLETGCLNVIRFDQVILVNAYFAYANRSDEEFVKTRQ